MASIYDLAIIGGGINGCGIARDAAGRGLSVLLIEQRDLASGTSSASTKLIHGGLRYLEHFEFRLVRESLAEREVLLRIAPHLVRPLRFVLPHHAGPRPWPLIRLGLFLYDHLGGRRTLPGTRVLDLRADPAGTPLQPSYRRAFAYSDCWVDDARLVILNARDAAARGAEIRTRTRCVSARREEGLWRLDLRDSSELGSAVHARALVNAAGPWVSHIFRSVLAIKAPAPVRLVKGSHLVLPRWYEHDCCYTFQNADGRVCFAIPYEDDFTLVGTTDESYEGDPADASVTRAEEDYLLAAINAFFRRSASRGDIVWRYSGVRPLRDDGAVKPQDATRGYMLDLDAPDDAAPLLSVFGGKLTTYRTLAEAAMARLARFFPGSGRNWTASACLPGGSAGWNAGDARAELQARYPFLPPGMVRRLIRSYGTLAADLLGDARSCADLGALLGADLTEREVDWLVRTEWARTAEDILWRRSKLGLRFTPEEMAVLTAQVSRTC